jgi:hypothetical protein
LCPARRRHVMNRWRTCGRECAITRHLLYRLVEKEVMTASTDARDRQEPWDDLSAIACIGRFCPSGGAHKVSSWFPSHRSITGHAAIRWATVRTDVQQALRRAGLDDAKGGGMKTASRFLSTPVLGCLAMCCIVVTGCTSTRTVVEPLVETASPSPVVDPGPPTGPPPGYVAPTNYWVREKIILTSAQEPSASATQKSVVSKGKKSKKTGKRVTE